MTIQAVRDKEANEATLSEITRALIKSLPRLISKHQTDESRIGEVMLIPQLMNVDMYLEMRMVPVGISSLLCCSNIVTRLGL